jgi:O-antigen ligase
MNVKIQNFLLYLFSLTLVFEVWEGLSLGGNSIPKFVAIILIIALLFLGGRRISYKSIRAYTIPLIIFGITLTIITLYNYNDDNASMKLLPGILMNIILFIFILRFVRANPRSGYKMMEMLTVGILIMTVLFIFGIGVDYEDGRLTIFGENSNKVGLYAITAFMFILSTIVENPLNYGRSRYYLIIALAPLINMVAQSASRVTFFSFIIILLLFFILKGGKSTIRRAGLIIFGFIAIYVILNYLLSFEILRNRVLDTIEDKDLAGRDLIWESFLPLFISNPVFGVGLSGYTEASYKIYKLFYSPHNVFLEVAIYTGLIGLIAFLVFLYRVVRFAFNALSSQHYILPLLLIVLIILICFSGQMLNVKPYWMIIAYILSVPLNRPEIKNNE